MAGDAPQLKMILPPDAYKETPEGQHYPPVVPDAVELPELSAKAVLIGALVGVIFGAANAYLGLKVGLTVSASIPAAVIGVALFRLMRSGSLLETNIVQTIGSAGESLAAGVIFTLPVLYLWGESPGFWPIFPLALLGGLLGVFFMIPLRRYLIVQEHGRLSYPEGTACAEVQVASQAGGSSARLLFAGMGLGALYTALEKFAHAFPAEVDLQVNSQGYRTSLGGDVTPELLGVGAIIGPKVSAVMLAGGAVGWLVIIPLIYAFGGMAAAPVPPETTALIADMDSFTIWSRYLRYVGAGAVAFGGLFTLIKSTPTLVRSFQLALAALQDSQAGGQVRRTEQELSLKTVGLALLGIALLASFLPLMSTGGSIGPVAGVAVVVFAFFFVTVSSRIVGLIGSSSNPISGMTIATVLVCALLFGSAYEPRPGQGGGAHHRGAGVHRGGHRRRHQPGPEDRLPRGRHAASAADRRAGGRGGGRAGHVHRARALPRGHRLGRLQGAAGQPHPAGDRRRARPQPALGPGALGRGDGLLRGDHGPAHPGLRGRPLPARSPRHAHHGRRPGASGRGAALQGVRAGPPARGRRALRQRAHRGGGAHRGVRRGADLLRAGLVRWGAAAARRLGARGAGLRGPHRGPHLGRAGQAGGA
ncbi:MAG: oligopeptide transporter, OPT family [Alphaproteobacteria bacterium]|nr:oligopeptide transporter, OPT family [Alphaproteobacteria bacterium]